MLNFIIFSGLIVFCAGNYGNISLIDFDLPCSLDNGENGEYALITNCPAILKEVRHGSKFPKVCETNEICWDVVCCNGKTKYGSSYDLQLRIERDSETCTVQATGDEGTSVQIKFCPSLIDKRISRDPICPFTLCENYVCCPRNTTDVLEKSIEIDYFKETCIFDKIFEYSLAFELRNGCTCKPYFKCDEYANSYDYDNDTFSVNVTLCGYNCCVPMVCCPSSYIDSTYGLPKYKHLPITKARSGNWLFNGLITSIINQKLIKLNQN